MNRLCAALLFVPVLHCPPASAADLCPLVAELNLVLADSTGYRAIACPRIGFSILDGQPGMRSQAGAYFPETGRIELAPDLDLTTAYGQSFLLHEMVHAAQFAHGADKGARCPAALEAEAYRVQAQFLQEAGLMRDALLTRMLGDQLGQCGAQPDY
ncbi:DUF6647 family protein [Tabrizicola sp.]|uniref:DUF6647 family protein n=1 Tax=Tabrizicola sp. TaxID=2005166 RepID=UPI002736ABA2|nr:DUF6647 family protein [Tabrizicola sp.]MDP3194517.1 hypothetical protein [Tabrizicola sp.]